MMALAASQKVWWNFTLTSACLIASSFTYAWASDPSLVRVGLLVVSQRDDHVEAFRDGLRHYGYVEGDDFVIEYRSAEGNMSSMAELASELVELDVDVIVTHSTPGTRAAKKSSDTIPIVMASVGNAVESELVESFARPGGNVTGNSFLGAELSAKRIELLKEVVPTSSRLAILAHPSAPRASKQRAIESAELMGLKARIYDPASADEIDAAFSAMEMDGIEVVAVLGSSIYLTNQLNLIDAAARHSLPTIYPWRDAPENQGLMSLGPDHVRLWRNAASFVHRILDGVDPAVLPVERAIQFELIVNVRTAENLGIEFPLSVLLRAKEIVE